MKNNRLLFTSVKGLGDLVILSNFIIQSNITNYAVLVTKRNYELALEILPDISKIFILDRFDNIPTFFDLKKNLFKWFYDLLYYRNILKNYINLNYKIVVDIDNIKNNFIYFGLNPLFIAKNINIYSAYESFFNVKLKNIVFSNIHTCIIFPFGSSHDRDMNIYLIKDLVNIFNLYSIKPIIMVHISHKAKAKLFDCKIVYFYKISDLINVIKNTSIVITVDSVALHLSTLYGIYSYVCSNKDSKFIPPYIIENNNFFNNNFPNYIIQKLSGDLMINGKFYK